MKKVFGFLLLGASLFALSHYAFCEEDGEGDMLELLREKARERETLFDNIEATCFFTSERSDGRASPRPLKAHWIRSGQRRLHEWESMWDKALPPDATNYSMRIVDTPEHRKGYYATDPDAPSGSIREPYGLPHISDHFSPELYGVTALPIVGGEGESGLGTLANFLDPRTPARYAAHTHYTRNLRFVGKETRDGRELLVVEETLVRALDPYKDPEGKGPKWEHTLRLYFDPALNYTCVTMETERTYGGSLHSKSRETMSDFRQVKPGLFIPFSFVQKWERHEWRGYPGAEWTDTYKIDALDFREGFDDSLFDIEFPAGTQVRDRILGMNYTVGRPSLDEAGDVVLETAEEALDALETETTPVVPEAPEEPAPDLPQPVAEPPSAQTESDRTPLVLALVVLACAVLVVAVFLFLRRRNRD